MMLAALGVILLVKPIVAMLIVAVLGHSVRTALTVALGLAQVGEFSFILADLARKHGILPDDPGTGQNLGYNLLVGGAILSITLNPLLFRSLDSVERWLRRHPRLWALLNARAERHISRTNVETSEQISRLETEKVRLAIVVGFGPVGQTVDRLLRDAGLITVILDLNMDTVADIKRQGQTAIFGDASRETILESAGVKHATHLVLTLPHATDRGAIVTAARNLNPKLKIFVRARYLREREELEQVGATSAIFEEAEAAVALARLVLADTGAGRATIDHAVRDIRTRLILENVSVLHTQPVRSIMIPWTRVRRLSNSASLDEVRRHVSEQHYSRWPVVDSQTGKHTGYLLIKDLIGLESAGAGWSSLVRPLVAVDAEDTTESTLQHFQREGATICLVTDHGSPVGIVTIEDILEQVVGRIEDEYPQHPKIALRDLVFTDDALLNLSSSTSDQAIMEMAAAIPSDRLPSNANIAELAIAREHEMSTNLGIGVAIPHARCEKLSSPLVVVGRSKDGIVFSGQPPEPVHLMFLLITPVEQPDLQVLLLSQIASAVGNPEKRQRLRTISSAFEVGEILAPVELDSAARQSKKGPE